jgi:predicted secreted protein
MGKQKGRTFLIKIGDGATPTEAFAAFGGMTGKSLKVNNARIDATTPDPNTPEGAFWRETLDDVKSVSVSGDVTLVDDAQEARIVAVAMSASAEANFEIVVPSVGTFAGAFSVEIEFGDDGKATLSMSLESTGAVAFTAA